MKSALWALFLSHRPLSRPWLLIDRLFVNSGGGTVDFQEFVGGLSAFSSRGGREEKLRCTSISSAQYNIYILFIHLFWSFALVVAFKVYDVDRDGYISNGELFLVLKMMVGNNLKVCIISYFVTVAYDWALYIAVHVVFNTNNTIHFLFRINNSNK